MKNSVKIYQTVSGSGNTILNIQLADGRVISDSGQKGFHFINDIHKTKLVDYVWQMKPYAPETFEQKGKEFKIPADAVYTMFNWYGLYNQWWKGDYVSTNSWFGVKTTNGNYIIYRYNQDGNREAWVIAGENVIRKDDAFWGDATSYSIKSDFFVVTSECAALVEEQISALNAEKEAEFQAKMSEMLTKNKGWYMVELKCSQMDHKRGGHRDRWTNWKILADSQMDAYNKAVQSAEEKGYFWFANPENCQIDFYGVWTDEKEQHLRDEGLI